MNDQSQMMNPHQVMSDSHHHQQHHHQLMNQPQTLMLNQLNQSQLMNQQPPQQQQTAMTSQPPLQMVGQMSQQQMVSRMTQAQMVVNQGQMMDQGYGTWSQPPSNMPPPPMNALKSLKFANPMINMYGGRSNNIWKGKKPMDKRKDGRRKDIVPMSMANSGGVAIGGPSGVSHGGVVYKLPTLQELEQQNRLKARRFYHPRKKYNRMGPYAHAPRNTTSFIIRAKKSGGIASHISPYPVTPAVLPTPVFSPSREALVEMAKEEWGVDGYGSMKGLIRLRSSPGHETEVDDYEEEDEDGSSESDVEEHLEVERRLDHDLSRFEMIYPDPGVEHNHMLENQVDDQDAHIAQLEEENLLLKDRLYLMERELGDMRRRLQFLERQNQVVEVINDEVVDNVSENDSERLHSVHLLGQKSDEEVDSVPREDEVELHPAEAGNQSVVTLGNMMGDARAEEEANWNVTEAAKQNRAIGDKGYMLVEVYNKDGAVETVETHEKGNVVEGSGIEWDEKRDLGSGSAGIEVKVEEEDTEGALNHELTGDSVIEDLEETSDAEANEVNGNKDMYSVNAGIRVEDEGGSSGELLTNEPVADLCVEDLKVTRSDEINFTEEN